MAWESSSSQTRPGTATRPSSWASARLGSCSAPRSSCGLAARSGIRLLALEDGPEAVPDPSEDIRPASPAVAETHIWQDPRGARPDLVTAAVSCLHSEIEPS